MKLFLIDFTVSIDSYMGIRRLFIVVKKILLLAVFLSVTMITTQVAFASSDRNCNLKQICAQPGDYLTYKAQVYGHNGTITYNFGNLIDSNTIKVAISTLVGAQTINSQSILNLKNTTLINSDGSKGSFFFMVLTPINPNEIAASPFKESTDVFNGYQRSIYVIEESNGTDAQEVKVDKETGVLLDFIVQHVQMISGQQVVTGTAFVLADTNIITSSDLNSQSQTIPSPSINNTANVPSSVPTPSSISTASVSTPNIGSNDYTIIYVVVGIIGAGAAIIIIQKKKPKKTQPQPN